MILQSSVELVWSNKNRKYYENLGYVFTSFGSSIIVKVEHLQNYSTAYILVCCDCCGKLKNMKYADYNARTKNSNGVYSCKKCSSDRYRLSYEHVKSQFEFKNYKIVDNIYVNSHTKIKYICNKHPDKIQEITLSNLIGGHGCRYCHKESLSVKQQNGNHWNYQGGITGISCYLRKFIGPWQQESLKAAGYKCFVTGKNGEFHIHHGEISFAALVRKAHIECGIAVKATVSDYNKIELELLTSKVLELHFNIGWGVVMLKDVHKKFHKNYGKLNNNNINQLLEFKENYNKGLIL